MCLVFKVGRKMTKTRERYSTAVLFQNVIEGGMRGKTEQHRVKLSSGVWKIQGLPHTLPFTFT